MARPGNGLEYLRGRGAARTFRIDGVSVAHDRRRSTFTPVPPRKVGVAVEGRQEETRTVFEFDAHRLPVTGIPLNVHDRNFSRAVRVECRDGSRWFPVASEKVAAIDLPGERFHRLTVTFSREVREKCLRVVVENGDNPVLQYEDVPLSVLSPIYDAAFVAQPGVHYEVGFVDAAAVPRYDDVVLSYIERVRDPKVLRIDLPAAKAFRLSSGSSSVNWLGEHLLLVAYVLAFLVLLAVRLLLFRVKPCV